MSISTSRRRFIRILPAAGTLVMAGASHAQATVDEKDATAVGVGYVSDATKADKAKYPRYAAGQQCSTCALFQGAAGAASGPCPIFAGKAVSAKGWCSAYAKKG